MSSFINRTIPAMIATGCFILSSNLSAQTSDLIKRQEAIEEVSKQKLSKQITEAFEFADRIAKTSTVRAVERLRRLQISLENEPALTATARKQYTTQIAEKIRAIESRGNRIEKSEPSTKVDPKEAAIAKAKAWAEEYQDVKRTLDTIAALQKSGNVEQSKREAEALSKRYPNNPTVLALNEQSGMSQKLADAKILQAQQAEGYLLALRAVDKSAIPPKDDIEFDTIRKGYFKEITERRMKSSLTKAEQEILKALDKPISFGSLDQPFESVIEMISTKINKPIMIEKAALNDAQIDSNTKSSFPETKVVAARTVLRKVLQDQGLTFIIKNESIQVVTIAKARETMTTRVYYIGDLVNGVGPFGNALQWGPQLSYMQAMENANMIVQAMEKIDPFSWKKESGNGSATFHAPSMSIIVRQTAEVHQSLQNAFSGGR